MHKIKEWKLFMVLFMILMISTAASIPYALSQPKIALVTTTVIDDSVLKALNEMGRQFDSFDADDFSAVNFSPYYAVIVAMDGGSVGEPSIVNIANYANAGGNLIMLGGSADSNFANAVNTYLLDIDETDYEWSTVAGTPHLIVTNPNHPLSKGLPGTYDFVNESATYYMIRSQDAAAQVVAQNGDGFAALIQKPLGSGHLKWFINSPESEYWADTNDYNILKTILQNAAPLEVGLSGYPYTSIQAAINAAVPGDTVLVHDGTYVENINFSGKAITVKSVNGAVRTIINANGSGRGVTFNSGEGSGSVLDGFTITNGYVTPEGGGGIQCWNSSPTITNCIIIGNYGYNGGGISCYSASSPTISNCIISGNTSVWGGGGIGIGYDSNPTITNCTISGNSGFYGGAISCDTRCSPTITNCTISGNTSNTGGIWIDASSSPSVKNTILWGNTQNQIYLAGGSITLTYSNVDQDGYAGSNGNIRQNPLFVNAANGNFRLQPNSPCVDAATSDGAPLTDMKGNPRFDASWIPNTGGGTYPYYDIGALEYVKPSALDFDGDRKTDIAFYRAGTGVWWITPSSGAPSYGHGWGGSGFKPVPGDYDGDGKADIAIYDTTGGAWWIIPSSGTGPQGQAGAYGIGWGGSAFKPLPGDYDGDGKTDIAIYDTAGGAWWIIPSSGTGPQGQVGAYGVGWGGSAFKPVPGDYDGDGKADTAIYHASTGGWWIIPSSGTGPQGQVGAYGVGWGGSEFTPVPGDYDGDGKTDVAIYQSGSGGWWIIHSSDGSTYGMGWGGDVSDVPLTTNPEFRD